MRPFTDHLALACQQGPAYARSMSLRVVIASVLLLFAIPAHAWESSGHVLVGQTAAYLLGREEPYAFLGRRRPLLR